jgi:cellulose synthase/poly-beta-1,6-N-acetylglucosamine synthase-like glycosyltransferase
MVPRFELHPSASHLLLAAYLALWLALALLGLHRLHLIRLVRRRDRAGRIPPPPREWPTVTVQLPVYNERYVVERLLDAAAAVDYPRDRLEIQLLDDSTDETSALAARKVRELRAAGVDVAHLRRDGRQGYKAGALQFGLSLARGELLAVFDADFVPPPSILRDLVPHFADPRVGVAQARWQHLNRDYSLLSRAQAIALDGHFVVEQAARMRGGRFLNFNGTAGVLRKSCVLEARGWQHDTLTEDLDLSYRAQLLGWRVIFAPDVECPAELPVEMNAFKVQQHRWVKGSVQVARKLLPAIWRSREPISVKVEATVHLTSNVAYVLLLLVALVVYPVVLARYETRSPLFAAADWTLFLAATPPVLFYFAYAQRESRRDWVRQLRYVPVAMTIGVGLALNNTRAVVEGLVGRGGHFHRTPKFQIERRGDRWRGKRYGSDVNPWALLELALGAYFAWTIIGLARAGLYASIPFFCVYAAGFLYVGGLSLAHAAPRRLAQSVASHAAARPPYSTADTRGSSVQAPVARYAGSER